MKTKKISIAILGSRGIPNQYGGVGTFAKEVGMRWVQRGHDVSVYTSHDHPLKDEQWNGVKRILIHNPENKLGAFGQFIYDLKCNLHSRKQKFDIVLHLGYTSDSIWYWMWPGKFAHIVNMDGQEWMRPKYNALVRKFLRYAERLATLRSKFLVADSKIIEQYLSEKYSNAVRYISYGANIPENFTSESLTKYRLEPGKYDLMIARMEPDNNIEMAIKAKISCNNSIPLVVIGNENKYKLHLKRQYGNQAGIRFLDAIYQQEQVNNLRHFCRLYIHGHSVGGTNPSLLEAMACGCPVAAHNNPFNKSVLGSDACFFTSDSALSKILTNHKPSETVSWIENNKEKIRTQYNWEMITDEYEKLFYAAIASG